MLVFDQLKKNDPQLWWLSVVIFCGMGILLAGLWWVQVVSAREYQANLETQSFRTVRIPAVRGQIQDRNGIALAENQPTYNVSLYLEDLRKPFQREYARIRPVRIITNSLPVWKEWLGFSAVETQYVRLKRDQSQSLTWAARHGVASNVVQQIAHRVQQPLEYDPATFRRHYDTRLALPYPIARNIDAQQIARFEEQSAGLPGVDLEIQSTRVYPFQTSAAHVLGHLQFDDTSRQGEEAFFSYRLPDFRGLVGIEGGFDQHLRGRAGAKSVLVNNLGFRQTENVWSPAEPGNNLVLTIDLHIQQAAERALQTLGRDTRGAVVVMDVHGGDLLALVSSPTFNPNHYVQGFAPAEWRRLNDTNLIIQINRATQGSYPPGSIFKTVIGMAALETGLDHRAIHNVEADPRRPGRGIVYVGNSSFQDTAPPGQYDFRRALKLSSNAYFITNGLRAGMGEIVRLGQRLHLGERTGLNTYQEVSGYFPSLQRVRSSQWYAGNTALVCIGQDPVQVTPLQMAVLASAIANGGKVLWPRLVDRIESQDAHSDEPPVVFPRGRVRNHLGVKPQTLQILREAMLADVDDPDGTGRSAAVAGMHVCGKTGTAQKKDARGNLQEYITWFLSFAPYESPRYAVIVMVEGGASGGSTCAPVARDIYRAIQKREKMGPVARDAIVLAN
jgi:penicillin-binding protein 2